MSVDLDDQLAAYGSWLQQRYDIELTAPAGRAAPAFAGGARGEGGAGVEGGGHDADRRHLTPLRAGAATRWLAIAAALIVVVVGVGGLMVAQRGSPPAAVTLPFGSPIDPVAHLFVLPTDTDGLQLTGGDVTTARADPGDAAAELSDVVLIGTESDGSFSNLVSVVVADALPRLFGGGGSREVETSSGPALVGTGPPTTQQIAQQRGDVWLLLAGSDPSEDLTDVLQYVEIGPDGSILLSDPQRTIVEEFALGSGQGTDDRTYYNVNEAASGTRFVVETATSPSALVLGTATSEMVVPTTVNGTRAWIMTRGGESLDDLDTAIVWRASPNRVVAVSAPADADAVRAMAERLEQVTEQEWLAALPGAFIEE